MAINYFNTCRFCLQSPQNGQELPRITPDLVKAYENVVKIKMLCSFELSTVSCPNCAGLFLLMSKTIKLFADNEKKLQNLVKVIHEPKPFNQPDEIVEIYDSDIEMKPTQIIKTTSKTVKPPIAARRTAGRINSLPDNTLSKQEKRMKKLMVLKASDLESANSKSPVGGVNSPQVPVKRRHISAIKTSNKSETQQNKTSGPNAMLTQEQQSAVESFLTLVSINNDNQYISTAEMPVVESNKDQQNILSAGKTLESVIESKKDS